LNASPTPGSGAAAIEVAPREWRHFMTNESKRHTLAEFIERYDRDILPLKKNTRSQRRQLKWWKEDLAIACWWT
jgi:hypothetical protein